MPLISTTIVDVPDVLHTKIINVSGEVDEMSLAELVATVKKVAENESIQYLVIDISGITFMNSKGIGYLISLENSLTEQGKEFLLAGTSDFMVDLMPMLGITEIIPYFDTVEESLQAIKEGKVVIRKKEA